MSKTLPVRDAFTPDEFAYLIRAKDSSPGIQRAEHIAAAQIVHDAFSGQHGYFWKEYSAARVKCSKKSWGVLAHAFMLVAHDRSPLVVPVVELMTAVAETPKQANQTYVDPTTLTDDFIACAFMDPTSYDPRKSSPPNQAQIRRTTRALDDLITTLFGVPPRTQGHQERTTMARTPLLTAHVLGQVVNLASNPQTNPSERTRLFNFLANAQRARPDDFNDVGLKSKIAQSTKDWQARARQATAVADSLNALIS